MCSLLKSGLPSHCGVLFFPSSTWPKFALQSLFLFLSLINIALVPFKNFFLSQIYLFSSSCLLNETYCTINLKHSRTWQTETGCINVETEAVLYLWRAKWALLCQLFRNKLPSGYAVLPRSRSVLFKLILTVVARVLIIDIL